MYEDVQLSSLRKTKKKLNFEGAAADLIVRMLVDLLTKISPCILQALWLNWGKERFNLLLRHTCISFNSKFKTCATRHSRIRRRQISRELSPLRLKVRGTRAHPAPVVPTAMYDTTYDIMLVLFTLHSIYWQGTTNIGPWTNFYLCSRYHCKSMNENGTGAHFRRAVPVESHDFIVKDDARSPLIWLKSRN